MNPPVIPSWLPLALAGIGGACIGSFFNVLIHRVPRGESILWPGSHCPSCGHKIPAGHNVPLISWLVLKGRCHFCREPIAMRYPAVELTTAIMSMLLYWTLFSRGLAASLDMSIGLYFFTLASIPIFILDVNHHLIPDALNFSGMILGLGLSFFPGGISPLQSLTGLLGAGFFLWLLGWTVSAILKKEALGLGDVKLLAMAGSLFGLSTALFGLVSASLLGCLVGIPLLFLNKLGQQKHLPFGPFLCLGIIFTILWGDQVLSWYYRLIGL
ncbi:prepilin peptidase [Fibrobacterota bacterium]